MKDGLKLEIRRLVQLSLAFHNLNKATETALGLSLVQYRLLHLLKEMPGVTPQCLAKEATMHPSTLTPSLKRFQKRGFVFIGADPRDSRKKILALTPRGYAAIMHFETEVSSFFKKERPRIGLYSS